MTKPINHAGGRYGRLVAIKDAGLSSRKSKSRLWLCQCDCGNEVTIESCYFRRRRSCGCSRHGYKHGQAKVSGHSRIYRVWADMKSRCSNPNDTSWENYGGRGIFVCKEWESFDAFYRDMGATYQPWLTIERKNNDLGYSKDNCIWITKAEQSRNTRNVRWIKTEYGIMPLIEAAERFGITYKTVEGRIRRGWPEHLWLKPAGFRLSDQS